jgi:hypothetical protein
MWAHVIVFDRSIGEYIREYRLFAFATSGNFLLVSAAHLPYAVQ